MFDRFGGFKTRAERLSPVKNFDRQHKSLPCSMWIPFMIKFTASAEKKLESVFFDSITNRADKADNVIYSNNAPYALCGQTPDCSPWPTNPVLR